MNDFLTLFKDYKKNLYMILSFLLIYTILQVLTPILIGWAIGLIGENSIKNNLSANKFSITMIFISITLLMSFILNSYYNYLFSIIVSKITHSIRINLLSRIHKNTLVHLRSKGSGQLLSRFTNDLDNIQNGLNDSILPLVSNSFLVFFILISMFIINYSMALITAVLIPLMIIIVSFLVYKSNHYTNIQQSEISRLNGFLHETISSHKLTIINNNSKESYFNFIKLNNNLTISSFKAQLYSSIIQPIVLAFYIMNISLVIYYSVNIFFNTNLAIHITVVVTFINFCYDFYQPIVNISKSYYKIQNTLTSIKNISNELATPIEFSNTKNRDLSVIKSIEFKNVSFYLNNTKILNDISFKIKKGEKVSIIGPTGSGKTTILHLLNRLYDEFEGEILINNNPISDYNISTLRKKVAIVFQETVIFTGSIKENITFGNFYVPQQDIEQIAIKVGLHHFINSLPDKYNTIITPKSHPFSSSQLQLISLVRALLQNSDLILLDEAVSNLNNESENNLFYNIRDLTFNKTIITVTHKMKSVRNCDNIIVLKEGNLI
ncbi:ABC transporter ATP-binding protein, partial [Staphylococcus saccharolyticus]